MCRAKDGKNLTLYAPKFEGGTVDQLDLRINDISREDHGNYTCICKNSVGSEESTNRVFLNVQCKSVLIFTRFLCVHLWYPTKYSQV